MLQRHLLLRVAGPTVLVSLLLLGLCTATAVYLYRQQATTAHMLDKHVVSRKIDHELETAIDELIAVHRWETAPAIVHRDPDRRQRFVPGQRADARDRAGDRA